jgi:hypothetical protein
MSRSGYSSYDDGDYDQWATIRWAGALAQAVNGKRGQAFLHELIEALDAMPVKELIENALIHTEVQIDPFGGGYIPDGPPQVCALGSVGVKRGINMVGLDPEDAYAVSEAFGITRTLAQEVAHQNDEAGDYYQHATPEQRWKRVRDWASRQLKKNWPVNAGAKAAP